MTAETETRAKNCTACRIFSAAGLVGIGAYLGNAAFKNKTFAGKFTVSTLSFVFVVLGVHRYKERYPFDKKETQS